MLLRLSSWCLAATRQAKIWHFSISYAECTADGCGAQKERNPYRKRDLQAELTRMDQQLRNEQARRKKVDLEKSWKVRSHTLPCTSVAMHSSSARAVCIMHLVLTNT
jgi:hypothetical protein